MHSYALPCVPGGATDDFCPFAVHHLGHASVYRPDGQIETLLTVYFSLFSPQSTWAAIAHSPKTRRLASFWAYDASRAVAVCHLYQTRETLRR